MDFRYNRPLRIIAFLTLCLFCWTFAGGVDIAYAIKNSDRIQVASSKTESNQKITSNQQPKPPRPETKFQKTIDDIAGIVSDTSTDTDIKKNKLKGKKSEIESLDFQIKKQFSDTEKFLKKKNLPPEILDRHYKFVRHYEDNLKDLNDNLDAIDKSKTKSDADAALRRAKAYLEKVKPPKRKPLDPNQLPVRAAEEKQVILEEYVPPPKRQIRPDLKNLSDIKKDTSLQVAATGSLKGLLAGRTSKYSHDSVGYDKLTDSSSALPAGSYQIALATPPSADDLAENGIEIRFTPAIMAKAVELEGNPTKIYNWVRNNIEYVPTYGSIQGADMCFQTKQCNDTDTASLLISLYRASGIYAHYRTVTAQIPIEKVKNLAGGFTDSMAALSLLASAGIPVKGLTEAGQIKYVQMERTVVEAFIDYIPSRGEIHRQGDTWILLDASFKQYSYTPGIDIKTAVPFNAQSFIDQIKATATINETEGYVTNVNSTLIQQTMQDYQTQVQNYISQNYPNATVGDVLGKKEIIQQNFPYLLGTLPYRELAANAQYSTLPDNFRHKVSFSVISDNIYYDAQPLNITKLLPEIAGKKVTFSYAPATSADEAVINSYLPKSHADGTPIQPSELPSSLPAYLIQLKPELRIEGTMVATGGTIGMGEMEDFAITITPPNLSAQIVNNKVMAGEYNAVAIDVARIAAEQMTAIKTKLETTKMKLETQNFEGLTKDDILGDILYATILSYFTELDLMDYVAAKTMNVTSIRLPSAGRFFNALAIDYVFSMPVSASSGGLSMDAGLIRKVVRTPDGSKDNQIRYMLNSGANSSTLEHSVPEQLWSTSENPAQGISAVKALQIANEQGIPIYTINKTNVSTVLPQLQVSSDVKADIENAVNAGKEATVSKTNISYNGWTGCGYIIEDPNTGAGAYMISGGSNGAMLLLCALLPGCQLVAAILFLAVLGTVTVYLYLLLSIVLLLLAVITAFLLIYGNLILEYLLLRDYCGKEAANEYLKCLLDIVTQFLIGQSIEELLPKLLGKIVKWIEIYREIYNYYGCNKDLALTCTYGY